MPQFDAILFDFDGVLADSEPVHFECWKEILAPMGLALEWGFYRDYCIGLADSDMLRLFASRCEPPRAWEDLMALYPEKKDLFRERMMRNPPFARDLGRTLEALRRGHKMAVVTSSGRTEVEPVLEAAGLRRYFDLLVCGREAGALKPAPEPYLLAARLLGAARPLVVEDSEPGLAAAAAAGFDALAVSSPDSMGEALLKRLG